MKASADCMLFDNVAPLSHRFSCVLVTSSFAPEGHSCLCQQSPDRAPFVAQHVQDAPLPPSKSDFVCLYLVHFRGSCAVSGAPAPLSSPWRSCLVVHCLLSFFHSAGAHNAVINTNVTCRCAGRPRNRSSLGRKSLWWTETRKKMYWYRCQCIYRYGVGWKKKRSPRAGFGWCYHFCLGHCVTFLGDGKDKFCVGLERQQLLLL